MEEEIKNTNWKVAHDSVKKELEAKEKELEQTKKDLFNEQIENANNLHDKNSYFEELEYLREYSKQQAKAINELKEMNSAKQGLVTSVAIILYISFIGSFFYMLGGIYYCN